MAKKENDALKNGAEVKKEAAPKVETKEVAPKKSESYIDRLIVEKKDLDVKIGKLKDALKGDKIPEKAININKQQLRMMQEYSRLLGIKAKGGTNV